MHRSERAGVLWTASLAECWTPDLQVTIQRGRLCVSVRAGRQGELPKGSVKLGTSRTGATLYMEPAPLVDLNNAAARLAAQEGEAELAVLQRLSQSVARHASQLLQVNVHIRLYAGTSGRWCPTSCEVGLVIGLCARCSSLVSGTDVRPGSYQQEHVASL